MTEKISDPFININFIIPIPITNEQKNIINVINKKEGEIFVPVQAGFDKYYVSNLGRVWSDYTKRCIYGTSPSERYEYASVSLAKENQEKSTRILRHRLVAYHFHPNPDKKPQVNHINCDKNDNRAENLEWTTGQENSIHGAKNNPNRPIKSVQRLDPESLDVEETYDSMSHANGYTCDGISDAIKYNHKHRGFYWKFTNEEEPEKIIEGEIWRYLKDSIFEEVKIYTKFQVSNYGRVKGMRGQLLKEGQERIGLCNGNKKDEKKEFVCKLVLMAFNRKKPEGEVTVDHIDSNYKNNRLDNLRWATPKEQMQNPETIKKRPEIIEKKRKKIKVTYPDGSEEIHLGQDSLAEKIGISKFTINNFMKSGEEYKEYIDPKKRSKGRKEKGYKFELIED